MFRLSSLGLLIVSANPEMSGRGIRCLSTIALACAIVVRVCAECLSTWQCLFPRALRCVIGFAVAVMSPLLCPPLSTVLVVHTLFTVHRCTDLFRAHDVSLPNHTAQALCCYRVQEHERGSH